MKRAVLNIRLSAHELVGHELRELIPMERLKENDIPISTILTIDAENEEELFIKLREILHSK